MRDIDQIIERLVRTRPDVSVTQLRVKYKVDDDGLWFFRKEGSDTEVNLESTYGRFPFLVESNLDDSRRYVNSVEDAVDTVLWLLDQPSRSTASGGQQS